MTETHPPSQPTTLVARGPEDLLAMVPIVLGFTPTDSVVMLTFGTPHPFHARIDLPDRTDELAEMAEALFEPARRHRVEAVVLVVYSTHAGRARRAWRALRRAFDDSGIRVLEVLRADGRRWYPMLHGDRRLREDGVPYDVSAHRFAAQSVLDGRVTRGSREEVAALLDTDPERAAAVEELAAGLPDPQEAETERHWVDRRVRRYLADGVPPSDADVARLLRLVRLAGLRDAALASLTRASAPRHVDLWVDVLRRTPTPYVPRVAGMLALAAWQDGHGALAWCAVDRCTEVDPDDRLAGYVATALTRALPPSTWRPGPGLSA